MNFLDLRRHLLQGQVIPAHPLALTADRALDERHQKALTRYYVAAGAGGMAVGVHTTQFAIRQAGLLPQVLKLASGVADDALGRSQRQFVKIAGICGMTDQAVAEAHLAVELGYHAGLVSLGALAASEDDDLVNHCATIAEIIPMVGFYLQPAVGGRVLSFNFWQKMMSIGNLVAIKIAPFNRYQTMDVVRAVAASGRSDVALYTGNDDNILIDLLTPYSFAADMEAAGIRIVGGLLGHWAVWTSKAVELVKTVQAQPGDQLLDQTMLTRAVAITDANAAFFDAAHGFLGCIPGIHEVLRRQGLMKGIWCLDPCEQLSAGQAEEIDRVLAAYPDQNDDEFVESHLQEWLS